MLVESNRRRTRKAKGQMETILAIIVIALGLLGCIYIITTTIIELRKLKKDHTEVINRLEELKYLCEDAGQEEDANALDYAIKNLEKN